MNEKLLGIILRHESEIIEIHDAIHCFEASPYSPPKTTNAFCRHHSFLFYSRLTFRHRPSLRIPPRAFRISSPFLLSPFLPFLLLKMLAFLPHTISRFPLSHPVPFSSCHSLTIKLPSSLKPRVQTVNWQLSIKPQSPRIRAMACDLVSLTSSCQRKCPNVHIQTIPITTNTLPY